MDLGVKAIHMLGIDIYRKISALSTFDGRVLAYHGYNGNGE